METLMHIYNDLKETYGTGPTIRALCASGGVCLILLALLLKPEQPVIIINEIKK